MQVEDEGWILQPLGEPAPCGWVGRYTFPVMEYVFQMLKMLIQDKNSRSQFKLFTAIGKCVMIVFTMCYVWTRRLVAECG